MPYSDTGSDVPSYVHGDKKRRQWAHVWNSAYQSAIDEGKSHSEAEQSAFAEANGVAGPNKTMSTSYFNEATGEFCKFVRLVKVDESNHSVYGLATSEAVDCDNEIADYAGSKTAFQEWSNNFLTRTSAAGQDASLGNIRLMHGLELGGKVVKIDYKDDQKEVWLTTSPVNDDVWEMLKGGYLTGYSIGGKVTKRKKEGENTRYWFDLSEVSYVDNPANPEATFAYVKADGSVELRKFRPGTDERLRALVANAKNASKNFTSMLTANDLWEGAPDPTRSLTNKGEQPVSTALNPLISPEQYSKLAAILDVLKEGKTKRVAGEDLPPSAFAYVGDKNDTSTWKLPLHFSSEEKSKRHVRNALARFNQTQGIPDGEREKVHAKIVAAAKKYGIEVADEEKKAKAAYEMFKSLVEAEINKFAKNSKSGLKKSMYQVGALANILQDLSWLYVANLQDALFEEDDRDDAIAVELQAAIEHLVSILKDIVEEETSELIPALKAAQLEITTLKGEHAMADEVIDIAAELADLAKAGHTMKAYFKKMAGHHEKMAAHHEKMAAHHTDVATSHDAMCEAHKAAMGKGEDMMSAFHKAGSAHHSAKAKHHGDLGKAHGKVAEAHKAAHELHKAMGEHYDGGLPENEEGKAKAAADAKAAAEAAAKAAAPVTPPAPVPATDATSLLLEEFKKLNANFGELKKSVEEVAARPVPAGTPVPAVPGVEVPRTGTRPNGVAKSATADLGI